MKSYLRTITCNTRG